MNRQSVIAILLTGFCGVGVVVVSFYFLFIRPVDATHSSAEYGQISHETQNKETSNFADRLYEGQADGFVDKDALSDLTDLDEFAVNSLPFYLREYLQETDVSNSWHTRYITDSYMRMGDVDYIRLTIDEYPDSYFNCGYSISKRYWLFNKQPITQLPDDRRDYRYVDMSILDEANVNVEGYDPLTDVSNASEDSAIDFD